jgi:hypothetical protein
MTLYDLTPAYPEDSPFVSLIVQTDPSAVVSPEAGLFVSVITQTRSNRGVLSRADVLRVATQLVEWLERTSAPAPEPERSAYEVNLTGASLPKTTIRVTIGEENEDV